MFLGRGKGIFLGKSFGRLFKRSLTETAVYEKSLDLYISSLVGQFKKVNAFLIYSICFNETVHDKWCLDKSDGQNENDLEHGFVKHWLNSV